MINYQFKSIYLFITFNLNIVNIILSKIKYISFLVKSIVINISY